MHKKVEAELVSLANSILQMENRENVNELHKKSLEIYEKLSILKFVDAYMNSSTSETLIEKEIIEDEIENVDEIVKEKTKVIEEVEEEVVGKEIPTIEFETKVEKETELEAVIEESEICIIEELIENEEIAIGENGAEDLTPLKVSLEEEFKDAISADVATELFEKVTIENPVIEQVKEVRSRSLNDTLFKNNLQVGLNDRIAFVKYLFDGSQEDFNRVISQLNSFKQELDAKKFITEFVKPDYNWNGKEEYEERLINIIERKFM